MSRVYNEDATTYALGGLLSRQQITRSSEYRITRARYFNLSKQDMRKRIWSYAEQLVDEKGYVSPVDLPMDCLTKKQLEDWRFRRIPYLEQVTEDDLNKVEFIVNELREFGKSAKLKSSQTVYVS